MKLLKQCTLDGVTRRKDKSLKISGYYKPRAIAVAELMVGMISY